VKPDVEVHQQAEPDFAQPKVREQLGLVDCNQHFNSFQLHDQPFIDQDVEDEVVAQVESFVSYRQLNLWPVWYGPQLQFVAKTPRVDRF